MKRIIISILTLLVCSFIMASAQINDFSKEQTKSMVLRHDEFFTDFTEKECPAFFLLDDVDHIFLVYIETSKYIALANEILDFSKEILGENYLLNKKLNNHIVNLKKYHHLAKIKLTKYKFDEILDAKDWYEASFKGTTDNLISTSRELMCALSVYRFRQD